MQFYIQIYQILVINTMLYDIIMIHIYEVFVNKSNFSMNLTDSDSSFLKLTFELNLIKLDLNFSHLTNLTLYHI